MSHIRPRTRWMAAALTIASATALAPASAALADAGTPAAAGEYTYTARLTIGDGDNSRACSGVLVDASWVLTATSCFAKTPGATVLAGRPALPTTMKIGAGTATFGVTYVVPHGDRDVVLAKLSKPVASTIIPIKLAITQPSAGADVTAAGLGRTKTEWLPSKVHTAAFDVASADATTLTLTGKGTDAICQGDTGGPLINSKGELVGVNSRSWQGGCLGTPATETRTGAIASRVDNVSPWIDQVRDSFPDLRLASLVPNVTNVMTSGDFNRDGRSDVAAVTADGNLHAFAGRADGTFEYGRLLWPATGAWSSATKIIGGDFNGDGLTDIAAVWSSTGSLRLYAGKSDGSLAGAKAMWPDGTNWNGMLQLARFKSDGSGRDGLLATWGAGNKGDLYAYSTGPDGVLSGQTRKMWPDSSWQSMQKVATGDFNKDGRDDVAALAGDGSLLRYSGNAAGLLDSAASMWGDKSWNNMPIVLAGDFNGDGKADLGALWNNQLRFNLYRGNGQGALAAGTSAWPSPLPLPSSGQIRNASSGKCLEINNSSKDNGGLAQQWTCGTQAGAQWEFRPTTTTGIYQIVNVNSGKCLEIVNSSTDNGARAQQYTCANIPTMQWKIKQAGSTISLDITNVNSGKTLEINNSSPDDGAPAQQWAHHTDPSYAGQSWYV
ncbi:RICIN domain-containing protein [Streptomyces sp. NPDC002886]|uniref:RICIN domain-containing protein n=1 Tax=Streptomyces sp. NPDC002886 TaxID=3364667 RepID=UPI00367F70D9